MSRRLPAFSGLFLAAVAWSCAGCKPAPKVTSYEVSSATPQAGRAVSEQAPATAQPPTPPAASAPAATSQMPASAAMKAEAAAFGTPKWGPLPAGWTVGPANAMRKATFVLAGPNGAKAELAVTVFPGNVGGTTANVNRWRGQLGLSAAGEQEIAASARATKVGAATGQRFLLTSADGARSTDAVQVAKDGSTWFFKLSGDAAVVAAGAEAFSRFLSSTELP